MTVRIRLEAADPTDLDTHEAALRSVLDVTEQASPDYPNHHRPGRPPRGDEENRARRFLTSAGVRTAAAVPAPSPLAAAEDAKRARDLAGEIDILTGADAELRRQRWTPLRPGDIVLSYLPGTIDVPAYGQTFLAVDDTDADGNALLREVSANQDPSGDVPAPRDPDAVEYLLRYDTGDQRWVLDSIDAIGGDLQRWLDAPTTIGIDAEQDAMAWAVGEISEVEDGRDLTGWRELTGRGFAPVFADDDPPPPTEGLVPLYELWFEAGAAALSVIRAGAVVFGTPAAAIAAPLSAAVPR
jgi:hypothetical protein